MQRAVQGRPSISTQCRGGWGDMRQQSINDDQFIYKVIIIIIKRKIEAMSLIFFFKDYKVIPDAFMLSMSHLKSKLSLTCTGHTQLCVAQGALGQPETKSRRLLPSFYEGPLLSSVRNEARAITAEKHVDHVLSVMMSWF